MKKGRTYLGFVILALGLFFVIGSVMPGSEAAAQQKYSWRLQCGFPAPEKFEGYWTTFGRANEIARRVKERTNGVLDIKVFPPGALFKEAEALEAVQRGALELLVGSGGYHAGVIPEAVLEWGLPYSLRGPEQAAQLHLKTRYDEIMREAYARKGMYLLGIFSTSSFNYLTRFPIRTMDDLKGKKIRSSALAGKVVEAQGGIPTNIMGSEQYMALQRGTIDGTLFPPYTGLTYKLFEVVKYVSWPPMYAASTDDLIVNLEAWKKLPGPMQAVFTEEVDKMRKYSFEVSGPALEKLTCEQGKAKYGIECITLPAAEFDRFQKAALPLWDMWAKKGGSFEELVKLSKEVGGSK